MKEWALQNPGFTLIIVVVVLGIIDNMWAATMSALKPRKDKKKGEPECEQKSS